MMDRISSSEKRRSTQWAAQFVVAAELTRRGYTVGFTMGNNTPVADLFVGTRSGESFWVDVKGQAAKSSWNICPKPKHHGLYYILVLLAPLTDQGRLREADQFFVLSQDETNDLLRQYSKTHPSDTGKAPGFAFKDPLNTRDAWGKLPRANS